MARQIEGHPGRKFLRITEKPQTGGVKGIADRVLKRAGLEGFNDIPPQDAPRSVEISRSIGLGEYPNLHWGEPKRIAWAMQELSEGKPQGTAYNGKNFKVEAVRIDRKGREHVIPLGRWPLGWEGPVKRAHKRDVRIARRLMGKDLNIHALSTLKGQNPIRLALAREQAEAKVLEAADKNATVNGWFGWRARALALLAEANPERAANGLFANFLKPGQKRDATYAQLHTMMIQVMDEQGDPSDKIHGPFEAQVKMLQKFQRGIGGALLTSVVGDIPWFNKLTGYMINANKVASRDARTDMSIQGIARVGRRIALIDRYGKLYNEQTTGRGVWKWFKRAAVFPPDGLVEQATDRRMQRGNIARLAKTEAILLAQKWSSPLQEMHQQVVAEEFLRAYNAPAPQLEVLSHASMQSASQKAESTLLGALKVTESTRNAIGKATKKAASLIPAPLRRRKAPVAEQPAVDPMHALQDANAAYGGKPMSVKEQVDAILAHADGVLAE
ncbi:MAG TPA: hypothetical protein VEW42_02190, partial [Candidatus Eisenbacteria bacterium]|nr:hypothetical protein [Candidatus Eisenbacteria bacterium]